MNKLIELLQLHARCGAAGDDYAINAIGVTHGGQEEQKVNGNEGFCQRARAELALMARSQRRGRHNGWRDRDRGMRKQIWPGCSSSSSGTRGKHVPRYMDSELQRQQLGFCKRTKLAGIGRLNSLIRPSKSITMIVDGLLKDSDRAADDDPVAVFIAAIPLSLVVFAFLDVFM